MITLASISFIGTFVAIFTVTTLLRAPTLNNVAALLFGGVLFIYVCKITITASSFATNALLNVRALSLRTAIFLVVFAIAASAALYTLWASRGYP